MNAQAMGILDQLAKGAADQFASGELYGDFILNARNLDNQLQKLPELRRAAVALILFDHPEDGLSLLLSQRAKGLRHHAAQVGFPGGRTEPEDPSFLATAMRETLEEIGLVLNSNQLLSPLAPFVSGSGFWVQPFVFYVPALSLDDLVLDSAEVDSVFSVTLDNLTDPEFSSLGHFVWDDVKRYFATFKTRPNVLWGLSAGIVACWLRASGFSLELATPDPGEPTVISSLPKVGELLPVVGGVE